MIKIIQESSSYYMQIGYNSKTEEPKHSLELTIEELQVIAQLFTDKFAEEIGTGEQAVWEFGNLKLTDAPIHTYGWTDGRERVILHYQELKWHMIVPEIDAIGELAREILTHSEA